MTFARQTGSLINHLQARSVIGEPKPVVGMGCTMLSYSDRNAGTIVSVVELVSKRYCYEIKVLEDTAKLVSGSCQSESQEYEYSPGRGNPRIFRKLTPAYGSQWVYGYIDQDTGKFRKSTSQGLRIGERDSYYDPSF